LLQNRGNACCAGVFAGSQNSVYPAIWQSDNHRRESGIRYSAAPPINQKERAAVVAGHRADPGVGPKVRASRGPRSALGRQSRMRNAYLRPAAGIAKIIGVGRLGNRSARHSLRRLFERGRRRTRQDQIAPASFADEIADLEIRTERRKFVSSAGPVFGKSELFVPKIRSSRLT
jgi:hypothetical protein